MGAKIVRLSQIANPTIDQVFKEFLAEQRKRLKPQTQKKYEDVIELLQLHLNSYAYEGLSEAESALFDRELIAGKPESARIYHGFQVAKTHSMP